MAKKNHKVGELTPAASVFFSFCSSASMVPLGHVHVQALLVQLQYRQMQTDILFRQPKRFAGCRRRDGVSLSTNQGGEGDHQLRP